MLNEPTRLSRELENLIQQINPGSVSPDFVRQA